MRRRIDISIDKIEKYYHITEDGMVYSHIRGRWLRPQVNSCGYVHYCLSFGVPRNTWVFAHTLVAYKYLGSPPSPEYEIDHLDNNKSNNHYDNLMWRTHSDNILEGYRRGRRGYWTNRDKPSPVLATRIAMSNAKKKPVMYSVRGSEVTFDSIGDAADGLGTYRKKVYLCIRDGKSFGGGRLSFVDEVSPV